MKKRRWKRVLSGLLAVICTVIPLMGSVPVKAASGEIKIQQKDVYPMERYDSDGSLGSTWLEDILASSNGSGDHTSFCLDAVKNVKPGPAEIYPITDYFTQSEITTFALYIRFASEILPGDPAAAYGITQILIWEDLNVKYGWGRSWKLADNFISYDLQESLKSEVRGLTAQNMGRYIGHGEVYDNGHQPVGYFWLDELTGFGRLQKISANPGITGNNSCYSLEGASYGIYSDEACTVQVGIFTTDAAGTSNEVELEAGDYWVKELAAPKGFALDDKIYSITVVSGQTALLEVSDEPLNDPAAIVLQKVDKETGDVTQAKASLAGAQFTIKYYDGYFTKATLPATATRTWVIETKDVSGRYMALFSDNYKISGDEFYRGNGGIPTLPLGTVTIEETKAPSGYQLEGAYLQAAGSTEKISGLYVSQIREDGGLARLTGGNTYTMSDSVIRGGVKIKKYDQETLENTPQGDATLEGAEFSIVNMNSNPVFVGGKTYTSGQTVLTIKTDAHGLATTEDDALPYGHYKIKETKAPAGYQNTGITEQEFDINQNGVIVDMIKAEDSIQNPVIRGGVKIQKRDLETQDTTAMGAASLEGAKFAIIYLGDYPVIVGGKTYKKGETVMELTTGADGMAVTASNALPYGKYRITETEAPEGYLKEGAVPRDFKIAQEGAIVDLTSEGSSIANQVKRGDFEIRKIDADNQGTMAGIQFQITSATTGESHMFTTDANGYYSSESSWNKHSVRTNQGGAEDGLWFGTTKSGAVASVDDSLGALPYDTYQIEEIKGENNSDKEMFRGTISIRRDRVTVDLGNIENTGIAISTTARDADTDSHYSAAGKEVCIVDTVEYTGLKKGTEYVLSGTLMDQETGKPVLDPDGKEITAVREFTARIANGKEEVEFYFDGTALNGKDIVVFEELYLASDRDAVLAQHKDLDDEYQTIHFPGIDTSAADSQTHEGISMADSEVTVVDTVSYWNLRPRQSYLLEGILMDQETGEPFLVNGQEVTASTSFRPEKASGQAEVTFRFDGSGLKGKSLVVFETLTCKGKVYASHEDINAADQTIQIPSVDTKLKDQATDTKNAMAAEEMELVDEVSYQNLVPGKEYTMRGTLMDKASGKPFLVQGKTITAELKFTPEKTDGKVNLVFQFDGSALAGKTVVAFEKCLYEGVEVAVHEELESEDQSVHVPSISTHAKEKAAGIPFAKAEKKTEIIDEVSYTNLVPGGTYRMEGILMDPETGKALAVDGKEITAEKEFQAKEADGKVELEFQFDASALCDKTIVVFETCMVKTEEGWKPVAEHKDLKDLGQSVFFPSINTHLSEEASGSDIAKAEEKMVLVDEVSYHNLIPGCEYTMRGTLMDKGTGKALEINGKEVTAEAVFVPKQADGKVELAFEFDGSLLAGKTLVAFERCFYEGVEIAAHTDLEDEEQTVVIPSIDTRLKDSVTGTQNAAPAGKMVLVDEVSYTNLIPGREYTMRGTLMEKASGNPLLMDGEKVMAEAVFTPEGPDGKVELTFTFDGSLLVGKTVVAFEKCFYEKREVAVHADIESADQSVYVPAITTHAKDGKTGTKEALAEAEMEIIDEVSYQNLIPGMRYTMRGILMDKESGTPLLINGKEVTAEKVFSSEQPDGKVELTFAFDGSALTGKTLVVFERCQILAGDETGKDSWQPVAWHEDLADEAQAVSVVPPTAQPPKTGDAGRLWTWIGLTTLCAAGLSGVSIFGYRRRRRNHKEK